MQLHEKYRPTRLEDVVGQDKAVAVVRGLINRGVGGRALWFAGPSSSGKTTLARIVAGSIASDWMVSEFDSGADLTSGELDRLLDSLCLCGAGKGGRAVIVNESHSLNAIVIDRLKGVLERVPPHVVWVFTTTREDEANMFGDHVGAAQLLSRCVRVNLTSQGLAEAFAARLHDAASAEGLNGRPIADYVKLMKRPDVKNNLRAAFQMVEAGAMIGGAA